MSDITDGNKNLLRYILFVGKGGKLVLQKYLEHLVSSKNETLKELIKQHLGTLKSKVNLKQKEILEEEPNNLETWDISLLCEVIFTLFRHVINLHDGNLIRCIRDKRNFASHKGKFEISPDDFDDEWANLCSIFIQLSNSLSKEVQGDVQEMVTYYKRVDVRDIREDTPEDDELSSLLSKLQHYILRHQISEEQRNTIKEYERQLVDMEGTGDLLETDISIQMKLHTMSEEDKKRFEDFLVWTFNNAAQTAREPGAPNIESILNTLKDKLKGGINEIKNACIRCILIQVRCPSKNGLQKLLKFIISEEFQEIISQLSYELNNHSSQEVRITTTLSERSLRRIAAFIDGSRSIDILKNERACEKHPDLDVEYFCGTHDDVCCKKCFEVDHKHCQDIQYLTEAGVFTKVDVSSTLKELHSVRETVQETCRSYEIDLLHISSLRDEQEQRIFRQKMELQKALREIEKQQQECVKHYEKLEEDKIKEMEVQSLSCEYTLKEIETLVANVEKIQTSSPLEQFIAIKKSERQITRSKQIVIEEQQKRKEIVFSPEEILFKVEQSVLEETVEKLKEDMRQYELKKSSDETQSMVPSETSRIKSIKHKVKPVKHLKPSPKLHSIPKISQRQVNVSSSDDRGPTSSVGCCILPSGDIIIADNVNCRLKRIKGYTYHDALDLSGHPWDVCVTGKHSIAVAVFTNTLHFVQTRDEMTIERTDTLSHNCRSIAFDDIGQKLIVLDQKTVYVYSTSGIKERVLYQQKSPERTLRYIAVSPTGKQMCIGSFDGNLTTIDSSGKVLHSTDLIHTSGGLCYSSESSIYLCHRDGILRLGKALDIIDKVNYGISKPISVCFNEGTSELTVGQDNDIVTFLKMK